MNRQAAIERLLDHYQSPRNHGRLDPADIVLPGGQPDCDDQVTLYVRLATDGTTLERMTFEGEGCTVSQAAASILSELVVGQSISAIMQIEQHAMIDLLGREVVATRPRCATLALNTLQSALTIYESRRDRSE